MHRVRTSIRRKLLFATLTPLTVAILLSWFIGATLITDRVFKQAQQKVIGDLNSARKVYLDEINHLSGIVKIASLNSVMSSCLQTHATDRIEKIAIQILNNEQLSFLNVVDKDGVVRYRAANPSQKGDRLQGDPLIARALGGSLWGGTQVYTRERISRDNPALSAEVSMQIKPTPRSRPVAAEYQDQALVLVAASPIRDENGSVVGALQAGLMLNGDERVVDTITRIVYDREVKGAATVFLGDVRIATSVRDSDSNRATGTLMSTEVANDVLERGRRWSDRAFVLNDWFISAYEPIRDIEDRIVGALYVGMPEKPLMELRANLNLIFAGVLLFVSLIGVTLSTWISGRLARPVRALAEGARRIAAGEHIEPVTVRTNDEINLLAEEFNTMNREVNTLKNTLEQKVEERTRQLAESNQQLLDAQKELAKAERLAGLGMLAAGVAHEINNPLAVIRGNAELLQDGLPTDAEQQEEVEEIIQETARIERIVSNLRVFSRGGRKRVSTFDPGQLLDDVLDQINHRIPLDRYRIVRSYWGSTHTLEGDEDQLRQVFSNLITNGLQSMPEGGEMVVNAHTDESTGVMEISFRDYGCGIKEDDLGKLFTPFFSTKSRGTGLGLAVSYGIVSDHGGEIRVESRDGAGSTFTVRLPVKQDIPIQQD